MSWQHRAIYLHPPKTGGCAVRHYLWDWYGFARPPGCLDWHTGFIPTPDSEMEFGFGRYDSWLIFGTIRNPYARMVSWWTHCLKERQNPGWAHVWSMAQGREHFPCFVSGLLRDGPPCFFPPMSSTLAAAHIVLRQESLGADFVRLPFVGNPVTLPLLNTSQHGPWQDCYDVATAALVRHHYAADFARYGYSLEVT